MDSSLERDFLGLLLVTDTEDTVLDIFLSLGLGLDSGMLSGLGDSGVEEEEDAFLTLSGFLTAVGFTTAIFLGDPGVGLLTFLTLETAGGWGEGLLVELVFLTLILLELESWVTTTLVLVCRRKGQWSEMSI